jgi:hypothetical protein
MYYVEKFICKLPLHRDAGPRDANCCIAVAKGHQWLVEGGSGCLLDFVQSTDMSLGILRRLKFALRLLIDLQP